MCLDEIKGARYSKSRYLSPQALENVSFRVRNKDICKHVRTALKY